MYEVRTNPLSGAVVISLFDGSNRTSFMEDEANTDYQQYLAWLAEGNEPEIVQP
jgi:hypothetical protein